MHDARRATAKPETPEIRRHSGKRRLHLLQRKPPRPERSQRYSGARGSGNAAISTYSPIAPPRSGSTRPGLEIRFYSLASYFGLPDIRHNEARSALSERSDVRQGDIRTGPDHRTNYPNIASRNAEGRGGEAAGTENPAEDTASAPPDSGKGPAAPVRTGTRAASEIHPPPGMQPRAPESVQLLATAVPAVRLEARTHTNSFEKHIRSRRSRTFARFTKPEQIPGGTPRPPLQTISTDSRIVIRTG